METARDMHERHKQELKELQDKCQHPKISDWVDEWWAPAHSTGFQVRTCEVCEKITARRTTCCKCGKVTESYRDGVGTYSRPMGSHYCQDCFERTEEEIKEDERDQKQMEKMGHKKGEWF